LGRSLALEPALPDFTRSATEDLVPGESREQGGAEKWGKKGNQMLSFGQLLWISGS